MKSLKNRRNCFSLDMKYKKGDKDLLEKNHPGYYSLNNILVS